MRTYLAVLRPGALRRGEQALTLRTADSCACSMDRSARVRDGYQKRSRRAVRSSTPRLGLTQYPNESRWINLSGSPNWRIRCWVTSMGYSTRLHSRRFVLES